MNNKKIIIPLIIAILLIGIGYAAISSTKLTINGTASATADDTNFKVYFTANNTTTSNSTNVTTTVTAKDTTATVNISGLTKKGDSEYAILEIENGSNDIDASSVEVTAQGTDTSIIDIDVVMCDSAGTAISGTNAVASGAKTYVKITATLLQTPLEDCSTDITATITATPKTNS